MRHVAWVCLDMTTHPLGAVGIVGAMNPIKPANQDCENKRKMFLSHKKQIQTT